MADRYVWLVKRRGVASYLKLDRHLQPAWTNSPSDAEQFDNRGQASDVIAELAADPDFPACEPFDKVFFSDAPQDADPTPAGPDRVERIEAIRERHAKMAEERAKLKTQRAKPTGTIRERELAAIRQSTNESTAELLRDAGAVSPRPTNQAAQPLASEPRAPKGRF